MRQYKVTVLYADGRTEEFGMSSRFGEAALADLLLNYRYTRGARRVTVTPAVRCRECGAHLTRRGTCPTDRRACRAWRSPMPMHHVWVPTFAAGA